MSEEKKHYVKNRDFYEAIVKWRNESGNSLAEAEIPRYIAECIMKICYGLSYKPNFIGYSYIEEMRGDAIENCIAKIRNFDPSKSNNPFSFVTTIAWNAFLRRIETEKKESKAKGKLIQEIPIEELLDTQEQDVDSIENHQLYIEYLRENSYYDIVEKKKPKKKPGLLDNFIGDE